METIAKFFTDLIRVPIKNWYSSLSEKTRFIVNEVVVLAVAVCCFAFVGNYLFSSSLQNYDNRKTEIHNEGTVQRIDAQSSIYNNLQNLLVESDAKRACIVEMHNGVNNPSGLPYLYGEMTYEQPRESLPFIGDAFQKVTISTYKMGIYLHRHFEWIGSVDELKSIDQKLYSYVQHTDVKNIGIIALHNKKCEIGFLILIFNKENMTKDEQRRILILMARYANYIVPDLTMDVE